VLFTAGLIYVGVRDIPVVLFCFASALALFINLIVGFRIFVGNPRYAGGAIAHIGGGAPLPGVCGEFPLR
jgi:hypothetical protein